MADAKFVPMDDANAARPGFAQNPLPTGMEMWGRLPGFTADKTVISGAPVVKGTNFAPLPAYMEPEIGSVPIDPNSTVLPADLGPSEFQRPTVDEAVEMALHKQRVHDKHVAAANHAREVRLSRLAARKAK